VTTERISVADVARWIRRRADGEQRYLFGVTGEPGSGKSTLTAGLADELGAVVVPMDGFHLPNATLDEIGLRGVKGAPETFAADSFVAAVRLLAAADTDVYLPAFDRAIDEPQQRRIRVRVSDQVVIIEGNYLLLDTEPWVELRDLLDAVAHLDVDPALRIERLVNRHVRFGMTPSQAYEFVQSSDEPNAARIASVSHHADLIIDVGK
jgi:pantothenate kinase